MLLPTSPSPKAILRVIFNLFVERKGDGEKEGEGKGATEHKNTSLNYSKHTSQTTLVTSLDITIPETFFLLLLLSNFSIIKQSFKGGFFFFFSY